MSSSRSIPASGNIAITTKTETTNEALMDSGEFATLYREHQKMVRSVIFLIAGPSSLDDLVQEAFVRIWKGYPSFRHDSKLSSWIYRLSVNTALDHKRSQARKATDSVEDFDSHASESPGPDRTLEGQELVRKGLESLSEEHRTAVVLHLMQGLSIAEAAEVLEVSEGTVKSRLHYGKIELRKFLEAHGVDL